MKLSTCVHPKGIFKYGIHTPQFNVQNLRKKNSFHSLGTDQFGNAILNEANFPQQDLTIEKAETVFEIPNALPFKGTTYILKKWADEKAKDPFRIFLPKSPTLSLIKTLIENKNHCLNHQKAQALIQSLPLPILYSLATLSTDPEDLIILAEMSCAFNKDPDNNQPVGIKYKKRDGRNPIPIIHHPILYEIVANNPKLPDNYKAVMVLIPGAQGNSEIMGEVHDEQSKSHIFEYLRTNSYIPWGHFAANMANDAIRYDIYNLTMTDFMGLRSLYYQRSYLRLADLFTIPAPKKIHSMTNEKLEEIRSHIVSAIKQSKNKSFYDNTLWGWNYGFDFAPTGYRLNGSHQQIHQQFALIPQTIPSNLDETYCPFACGNLIYNFICDYEQKSHRPFFETYIKAIHNNSRMDNAPQKPSSLIVFEDENVMVFVPKAQTSQWELQVMTKKNVGNILEADIDMRFSLDQALFKAAKILSLMGAQMITFFEYSKNFTVHDVDQRLIYCILPKLPESPGGFSEAQLRWINGHYPEDFAYVCREKIKDLSVE